MAALGAASGFETRSRADGLEARFATLTASAAWQEHVGVDATATVVGVDFGGAAKGLGLDRAAAALRGEAGVEAAIISAGSTTIAMGSKPDETPWKIGIEDPRDPETVIAVVESAGDVIVSTSGDYQRYFEDDGTRYHHILDPTSGMPAPGTRSLTVVGTTSGLDSDILSTALFVMGPERARAYAEREGLGLYVIDDEGRTLVTPGPDASFSFEDAE
jgi:thiamine biosynthesis lipoprotein